MGIFADVSDRFSQLSRLKSGVCLYKSDYTGAGYAHSFDAEHSATDTMFGHGGGFGNGCLGEKRKAETGRTEPVGVGLSSANSSRSTAVLKSSTIYG